MILFMIIIIIIVLLILIARITAEQQSVMDAIQATIGMLSEAPLTTVRISRLPYLHTSIHSFIHSFVRSFISITYLCFACLLVLFVFVNV